jgi:uncharacterized protein YycO
VPVAVQLLLASVTFVTFLAAAVTYLRGSADKGTITSLQNSVAALKTEGEIKDGRIAECQAKVADLQRFRAVDQARIATLEQVVTSADAIANLEAKLADHHAAAMARLDKIARKVGAGA